ncbi:MAG: ImmA/IrrE family metallo-endopeptidase [Candidatus Thiodiazotropha endolucinida]
MSSKSLFQPDWVSPPGDTIAKILVEKKISIKQFSNIMEMSITDINQLISGKKKIDNEIAQKLETSIGSSPSFWIKRDLQYWEDAGRKEMLDQETDEWLEKLPLRDMVKLGWISPSKSHVEKKRKCLKFFDVNSVNEWYSTYNDLLAAASFRTSYSFDTQPESVISWLRCGVIESNKLQCKTWDAASFNETLNQIKHLTRIADPKKFVPSLKKEFARSGVALAIVPTPAKCRASGATFFPQPQKAILMLSFRYLSDDHFWFSLFHEAGHLLLHSKNSLFLENADKHISVQESEANKFAENILIPLEYKEEFLKLTAKEWRKVIRFAKKIGVSAGVVVGQLQHYELIRHNQLNKFKVRYKWSDIY